MAFIEFFKFIRNHNIHIDVLLLAWVLIKILLSNVFLIVIVLGTALNAKNEGKQVKS